MFTRLATGLAAFLLAVTLCAAPAMAAADPGHGAEHGTEAAEGSHEGGVNPLTWQTDSALWSGVLFLLLVAVLWKAAWRPISDGLHKRENRIAEEIAAAQRTNEEAGRMLADYQQRLSAAEGEIRQMLEQARRDAEGVGRQIVEKARHDAEVEHQRALQEIDLATSGALKELAERSATLAVELAGRIVHERLDPQSHRRLIEQAVEGFARTNGGKKQ